MLELKNVSKHFGGVRAVDEALPALQDSGSGSIVFVGSMASKYHFGRPPSAYGPAKAAMRTYANELAQSYGSKGIRANLLAPGAVVTEAQAMNYPREVR